ncbi:MAG: hypothetical protein MI799_03695 [Desulfobacterales bacterium]|nr:hypothetical protein [Desulfobacterales bacterium]
MIDMKNNKTDIADLFNNFETARFRLIFMEAALRGMIETGIIEESGVSEGYSCTFNSIIQEYDILTKKFQKYVGS